MASVSIQCYTMEATRATARLLHILVNELFSILLFSHNAGTNCQYLKNDPCLNITCNATDQCHLPGVCVQGTCTSPRQPDNTPCTNPSLNFTGDVCVSGVCTNRCINVTCPPPDQCHWAGGCANGLCLANPAKLDLTQCSPALGVKGICVGGVCIQSLLLPSKCVACTLYYFHGFSRRNL